MEEVFDWSWNLGDRLRKALDISHVTREEMAEELGVTPPTVSRYLNGTTPPKRRDLKLWAQKTGVPLEALERGTPPNGVVRSRCSVQVRASDLDFSGAAQREEATGRVLATSAA